MKTRHTPGPWKVIHTPTRKETFWAIATANEAPQQALICLVDGISKAHQEHPAMAEANARLIAAAPALLSALRGVLACHGPVSTVAESAKALREAEAAIAAATEEGQ